MWIDQKRAIRVGMKIDEARCDNCASRIDNLGSIAIDATNSGDAIALNSDVSIVGVTASAIDKPSVFDYEIEHSNSNITLICDSNTYGDWRDGHLSNKLAHRRQFFKDAINTRADLYQHHREKST